MIKYESKFGILFRHWWTANRMPGSFELKDSRTKDHIPFVEVCEAQIDSGLANKSKRGNLVRVQNGTVGTADYIGLVNFPAYVVIKFPRHFEIIDIETFAMEKERSKTRRLTGARAKELSIISVTLKS